jgi:hypothetical protein
MAETEDCEYVFNWKTPSACAVEEYPGANCTVYDGNYGFYYDLSSLTDIYSYVIEGNIEYKVRFCGKSPTTASCGKDVDSCRVIGKFDCISVNSIYVWSKNVKSEANEKFRFL